jgi:RNA polymerase sigma-70 factor (ECF subfamily)
MDAFVTIRLPALAEPGRSRDAALDTSGLLRTDATAADEDLLTRIGEGERDALALLFRRYASTVRRIAFSVLRDTAEADDLLQDVFLLIYRKCRVFDRSKGPARFWILQMTYHHAISRRRYLNSRHFYTRLDLDDVESDSTALHASNERYEQSIEAVLGNGALEKMFQALSENQRQTLRLVFQEGYTLDEIAAELGQSRDNVRHHYFRGLEKLRKQIFGGNCQPK